MPINIQRAQKNVLDSVKLLWNAQNHESRMELDIDGHDSATAFLIKAIVSAVLQEIRDNADVNIINVPVNVVSPQPGSGFANGKADIV